MQCKNALIPITRNYVIELKLIIHASASALIVIVIHPCVASPHIRDVGPFNPVYTVSEEIARPHTLPGAGGHRPHLPRPRNGEEAMMEEKYTPVRELPEGKFGALFEIC